MSNVIMNKKGLRQCAKLHDCVLGIVVIVLGGENKVKSYFVGFAQKIKQCLPAF